MVVGIHTAMGVDRQSYAVTSWLDVVDLPTAQPRVDEMLTTFRSKALRATIWSLRTVAAHDT